MVLWRRTRPSRTNTKKRCPFNYRGLECKSRKSRDTWSNRHIWPWSTKRSRSKANRVLPREHTFHSKHPLPTTQEKTLHMDITRWSILKSDSLYSLQPKWRSFIQSAKTRPGTDCGSDHKLLIAKFRESYPLQYSGLENSMNLLVHGVWKSWTQLNKFHFTSFHLDVKVWKGYY